MRHRHFVMAWIGLLVVLGALLLGALLASPPTLAQDAPEPAAPAVSAAVQPESCSTCHKDAGAEHQAGYDQLYQDGVIQIADLAYTFAPTGTHTVTFQMTKGGVPFDARQADSLAIYFARYDGEKFGFDPEMERLSLKGDLTYDGAGGNTSTLVGDVADLNAENGFIVVYGTDEIVGRLPARVSQGKYPFAAILQMGEVDYVSSANNEGCVKCHTDPYLKHGSIYAQVDADPATDFVTCKACHQDNVAGGHFEWQLLVEDPALAASFLAEEVTLTPEQEAQFAYKTSLMNDVHMSHAMEFPYPQSMANCSTCHAGKLETVLSDKNFTLETCRSCHPMNGSEEAGTTELALNTLMAGEAHEDFDWEKDECTDCHKLGKKAMGLAEIHTGYDSQIYTADGLRYSDAISITIDSAAFDGSQLTFGFSARQEPDLGFDLSTITPTVMVGLYGYDTKDFLIGAHERLNDDNADGTIDNKDQRALEFAIGSGDHPRMTATEGGDGTWEVTADLSQWTDLIASGAVKRVEIAVMPALLDEAGEMLALNAPSRTFDLGANDFADDFYAPIAKVTDGCNNCHGALAVGFHEPDHGGNVVVCRMCHITKQGASHLEMQSRSLDSYVHAIHSSQAFDIADIDFADPVQAMHYQHHIEFPYPTHGNTNCESCHVEGMYDVPDQSMSLPGVLSASEELTGWDRRIGNVPSVITGPGARACGGCHRAELINEDDAGELVSLNQHLKQGGYAVEAGDDAAARLQNAIDEIMGLFQ